MRAWIVGQNEAPILGEGWYGRCHEWYGLPYRESFGRSTLRLPPLPEGAKITLVVGSALCQHCTSQSLTVHCGDKRWTYELTPPPSGYGWQNVDLELGELCSASDLIEITLEPQKWRHGDYEEVDDFREVGILLSAVLLND